MYQVLAKKLPGSASSTCKTLFENHYWKSHGIVGVYRVNYGFLLFLGVNQGFLWVLLGISWFIRVKKGKNMYIGPPAPWLVTGKVLKSEE